MLLLATNAAGLPGPVSTSFTYHPAVVIASDADFTAANGVTGGSGTAADPYVIEGWHFFSSTGITIRNTTSVYLIRENVFESDVGIRIESGERTSVVHNNRFIVRTAGVNVYDAAVTVRDNSFIGITSPGGFARVGVGLSASNAHVDGNAFVYMNRGIVANIGSPLITCNDMHDDVLVVGIDLTYTTNATVSCNILTRCTGGINVFATIGTVIANNTLHDCAGIDVELSKDVVIENNTVRASVDTQVWIDLTSGIFRNNTIIDGASHGLHVRSTPMIIAGNNVSNNIRTGMRLGFSAPDVEANIVSRNGVGIAVENGGLPHLRANIVTNNTVGLDIPYGSRQVVAWMEANIVNGVNVDGTIVASEQVYFYKEADVQISGQVRDSGFSAGYFGSISAQGNVVLWEVDTAEVDATVISHATIGVGVVNSFNVVVNASQILQAGIGVHATSWPSPETVPPCVVSVKDTNITIPVDPPATIGVELEGCLGLVLRTNISIVDIGVSVDSTSSITMIGSTVSTTRVGLDIWGVQDGVNLTGNAIVGNVYGARFHGTVGVVNDNRFEANAKYAARLDSGASLKLERNVVRGNGDGFFDFQACTSGPSCASVQSRDNVFRANAGDGLRVNGTSTLRGDLFVDNLGNGARLASATMLGVNATGNGGDGVSVSGTFRIEDSFFDGNAFNGLRAVGSGSIQDSRFTQNDGAGMRVSVTSLTVTRANVSRNFDGVLADEIVTPGVGTTISVPTLLGMVSSPGSTPDAMRIHLSVIVGNERDGIRSSTGSINATHNWWGRTTGPSISIADTIGAFQNGVSPSVRFLPYWSDEAMTTTGPVPGI